jgi:hypothetical protein
MGRCAGDFASCSPIPRNASALRDEGVWVVHVLVLAWHEERQRKLGLPLSIQSS